MGSRDEVCSWQGSSYPGFRLDFPYEDGAFVLDLDNLKVYDKTTQAHISDESAETEMREYMLNGAIEAWEETGRPGWSFPSQRLQEPRLSADDDFHTIRLADWNFTRPLFRYWQSTSFPGRRLYFPASEGSPQMDLDNVKVHFLEAKVLVKDEGILPDMRIHMIELALEDWDKAGHPNWRIGVQPSQESLWKMELK